jgi:hypothetical protein
MCLLPHQVRADDAALATVEKAIAAHGGKEGKLDKLSTSTITQKGTVYTPMGELAATRKFMIEAPKKTRMDLVLNRGDGDVRLTVAVTGNTGWQKISGMPAADITLDDLDVYQAEFHLLWVTSLYPLKDKNFSLTALPGTTINEKAAVGVKASYVGRPDVSLYFDKSTGLLVKTSFKGKEAGVVVVKESSYSDYKEFGGLTLPTKVSETVDRRKGFEWKSIEYEFNTQIPKDLLMKP